MKVSVASRFRIRIQRLLETTRAFTQEEEFLTVCANAAVIKTAMFIYLHDNGPILDTPENYDFVLFSSLLSLIYFYKQCVHCSYFSCLSRALRYTAYRQWTAWMHGKLGGKYRRPMPSCAVKEIRKAFPSPSGEYKGFEYAHHDM